MKLTVNGVTHDVDVEEDMPMLWVLRDVLGITGPKYGCGIAQCGACTVHMDGIAVRSCQLATGDVEGEITTIEGLGSPAVRHAVQEGQIMRAASFLELNPTPTDDQIDAAMSGNLCRCGTYPRIREAVKSAAIKLKAV